MTTVNEQVAEITAGLKTECEKAIALHDYVREKIKFGFTKYLDAATPDYTLNCGIGHCNPNSELMVAFFREAGLEAFQHFVALPIEIASGIGPSFMAWIMTRIMPEVSHSYTDVKVQGMWYSIDSYILDTPLLKAAHAKLVAEDKNIGYFTRIGATNEWNGKSDAFSQFSKDLMIEDHGRVNDLEAYYRSNQYRHKLCGVRMNTMCKIMGDAIPNFYDSDFEDLRRQYSER